MNDRCISYVYEPIYMAVRSLGVVTCPPLETCLCASPPPGPRHSPTVGS